MRILVLSVLTLASVATLADDASAFGGKRKKKSAPTCCPAPAPVAPCSPCGSTGVYYPTAPSGPIVMPGAVVPGTMPPK